MLFYYCWQQIKYRSLTVMGHPAKAEWQDTEIKKQKNKVWLPSSLPGSRKQLLLVFIFSGLLLPASFFLAKALWGSHTQKLRGQRIPSPWFDPASTSQTVGPDFTAKPIERIRSREQHRECSAWRDKRGPLWGNQSNIPSDTSSYLQQ